MKKVILLGFNYDDESTMLVLKEVARVIKDNGLDAEVMLDGMDMMLNMSEEESDGFVDKNKDLRGIITAEPTYLEDVRQEILTLYLFKNMEKEREIFSMIKGKMTGDPLQDKEVLCRIESFAEKVVFLIDQMD